MGSDSRKHYEGVKKRDRDRKKACKGSVHEQGDVMLWAIGTQSTGEP